MTGPRYNNLDITPTQVALELLELSRQLAAAVADFDQIEQDVVNADKAHADAKAKWMLQCRYEDDLTSADLRDAWVHNRIGNEVLARDTARAVVRARKLRIETIKTRVTIGQTVCNALQSELDLQRLRSR
jgi:hypothetical protein